VLSKEVVPLEKTNLLVFAFKSKKGQESYLSRLIFTDGFRWYSSHVTVYFSIELKSKWTRVRQEDCRADIFLYLIESFVGILQANLNAV